MLSADHMLMISDKHVLFCGAILLVSVGTAVLVSEVLYLVHVHRLTPQDREDVLHDIEPD